MKFKDSKYYDRAIIGKLFDYIENDSTLITAQDYKRKYGYLNCIEELDTYYNFSDERIAVNQYIVFDKPVHILEGSQCQNIIAPEIHIINNEDFGGTILNCAAKHLIFEGINSFKHGKIKMINSNISNFSIDVI